MISKEIEREESEYMGEKKIVKENIKVRFK